MKNYFRSLALVACLLGLLAACKSSKPAPVANDTLRQAEAVVAQADQMTKQLEERLAANPTAAVRDFVPYVEERKARAKKIVEELKVLITSTKKANKSQRAANDARVKELAAELKAISDELGTMGQGMEKELDVTLKADVLFATGSHKLSQDGQENIARLVSADIKKLIDHWSADPFLKDKEKLVKVYVNGYADKQGAKDDRRRQATNLELSQKRAAAVEAIIRAQLEQIKGGNLLSIEIVPEGHGESLPPGVDDNGKANDPRRRICMVSAYVVPNMQGLSRR
jgi:outer membrane protein OmpA-like peptidoglycan-associated protein